MEVACQYPNIFSVVQYQISLVLHRSSKQTEGHSNKNRFFGSENNVKCLDEKIPPGREIEDVVLQYIIRDFS
jgi:hypothetical protein